MAQYTWERVAPKQDISDLITNITPDLTLFANKFGKDTTDQMEFSWLLDSLRPPKTNRFAEKIEFTDADTTVDDRIRMKNCVQHFATSYFITDAQEKAAQYGVQSELEYQMVKKLKEIAQDFEYAIVNNTSMKLMASGTGNEGLMAGVKYFVGGEAMTFSANASTDKITISGISDSSPFYYLRTGDPVTFYTVNDTLPTGITANKTYYVKITDPLSGGSLSFYLYNSVVDIETGGSRVDITAAGSNTNGTNMVARSNVISVNGPLDESVFNDLMEKVWKVGGQIDTAYMSGKNKRIVSSFTANTQKIMDASNNKLKKVVDIYESDFGVVQTQIHRMYNDDRIELLNPSDWKVAYFVPFHTEDAPRSGTYKRKFINGMAGLKARSPYGGGALINLK